MGDDGGAESADGVGEDGLRGQFAVAEGIEHGGVGGEESAPAHADGGEHGDGVAVDPSAGLETGHEAEGGTDGAEGGDGEGNLMGVAEAEEPVEQRAGFGGEVGQDLRAFVGGAGIGAVGRRPEGEHHDEGRDDEHAGDNGESDVHAAASAVEEGVEDAHEEALRLAVGHFLDEGVLCTRTDVGGVGAVVGMGPDDEMLHEAGGDDAAHAGAEEADERGGQVALSHHVDDDDEAHAEGGAEVGEGDELVLLEIGGEAFIAREGDNGGVVAKKGHHRAERGDAGQVEERAHEGPEQPLQ